MTVASYVANYNSALSFLKLEQKDPAIEALERGLSQIPEDEKKEQNTIYLSILSVLSFLSLEMHKTEKAALYVEEGLAVKRNHADLLFVKSLLLYDTKRFDEMLEMVIHYLLALGAPDCKQFDYKYIHPGVLSEIYKTLIPTAYRCAFQHEQVKDIVGRLFKSTNSEWLKKAYEVMEAVDLTRSRQEN